MTNEQQLIKEIKEIRDKAKGVALHTDDPGLIAAMSIVQMLPEIINALENADRKIEIARASAQAFLIHSSEKVSCNNRACNFKLVLNILQSMMNPENYNDVEEIINQELWNQGD